MKSRFFTLAIASAALLMSPLAVLAASAALYVSPASGTVAVGSIIPVQVRVNTGGDPVNAVQANLSYNASQLAYEKYDGTGSAFSLMANTQADSGSLKMARATGGGAAPVTGDVLFVTVYFKAITTTGTSSVAIAADSHVVRSSDSVDIMAGAPAAKGPKASTSGAPKPVAYATLAQAQAAVAAAATPTPAGAAGETPGANTPSSSTGAQANNGNQSPATSPVRVLAWNSPIAWGGLVLLLGLGGIAWYAFRRRHLNAVTPAAATPAAVAPKPAEPLGSVDDKGVINPTTIYPNDQSGNDSNQNN